MSILEVYLKHSCIDFVAESIYLYILFNYYSVSFILKQVINSISLYLPLENVIKKF